MGARWRSYGARSSPTPLVRALRIERGLMVLSIASMLACAVWIVVNQPGATAVLGTLVLGMAVIPLYSPAERRTGVTVLCALMVFVSASDYLSWRWSLSNWTAWWISAPLVLAETFGTLHVLGLHITVWPRTPISVVACDGLQPQPIFVLIPTATEDVAILRPTIECALAARIRYLEIHPRADISIVVCNDGWVAGNEQWEDTERLAREVGVMCVTRRMAGGAKAGNLEHARRIVGATGNSIVIIFDADQIAERSFLLETIPHLANPKVGWVQTGQYYRNTDDVVARWANDQQSLFYRVLCPGKAAQNSAFICGTNVVIRAAALDSIGGFPQDSITEDFAASIRLHGRWRGVFVPGELAWGLGPMSLQSYFRQQRRWAVGTLRTLRKDWRRLVLRQEDGLSSSQRLQYALACTHYLSGLRDLIYIVAPIVFLTFGIPSVRGATLATFLWHFLPYLLASQLAFWNVAWGKTSLRGIVIGFASFPVLVAMLPIAILGRHATFHITAKAKQQHSRVLLSLMPQVFALGACIASLGYALWRTPVTGPVLVTAVWLVYSAFMLGYAILLLGGAIWAAERRRPLSVHDHFLTGGRARTHARMRSPWVVSSRAVLATIGCLVTLAIAADLRSRANVHASPINAAGDLRVAPGLQMVGLALSADTPLDEPDRIRRRLGLGFDVVGRSQGIGDAFDATWAVRLARVGARPWITILFERANRPAYNGSLPGIANGVFDDDLRRWAREIRSYGRLTYLTVLPEVDRSWVTSSAVANGGIPEDSARAFVHIYALFQSVGARNVAWLWAPADPAHDTRFAPPPATLSAVVLSLLHYPDTKWVAPSRALAATTARYGRLPIIVEIGASGTSREKAQWLRAVAEAVRADRHVEGVVYYDGSPDPRAAPSISRSWSLLADESTARYWQDLVRGYRHVHAVSGSKAR